MGGHPERTPFYGALMLITVLVSGLWVRDLPWTWVRVLCWIGLIMLGAAGLLMTFRDYS
ncbi:hypothetical protein ACWDOP_11110 [Nocardia sp. NPDC003693]